MLSHTIPFFAALKQAIYDLQAAAQVRLPGYPSSSFPEKATPTQETLREVASRAANYPILDSRRLDFVRDVDEGVAIIVGMIEAIHVFASANEQGKLMSMDRGETRFFTSRVEFRRIVAVKHLLLEKECTRRKIAEGRLAKINSILGAEVRCDIYKRQIQRYQTPTENCEKTGDAFEAEYLAIKQRREALQETGELIPEVERMFEDSASLDLELANVHEVATALRDGSATSEVDMEECIVNSDFQKSNGNISKSVDSISDAEDNFIDGDGDGACGGGGGTIQEDFCKFNWPASRTASGKSRDSIEKIIDSRWNPQPRTNQVQYLVQLRRNEDPQWIAAKNIAKYRNGFRQRKAFIAANPDKSSHVRRGVDRALSSR